jgi:ribosomal protein S18 acetylase RimI-like enzyme
MPSDREFTDRVRTAHGDAWQAQGVLRRPWGGDAVELPGIRLMASGLRHPQWNNGDVDDPQAVDVAAVRDWYSARAVPWGVRVPAGAPWRHGRLLFAKRLMGLEAAEFQPAPAVTGLRVRRAGPADLASVLTIDSIGFDSDAELESGWIEPHLSERTVTVALAELRGVAVATGYLLLSDGRAGPAGYLAGVTTLPDFRRRGIAAAVSGWLLERAFLAGAQLAHLHPDSDSAAGTYARLGFREVAGFDVYVNEGPGLDD